MREPWLGEPLSLSRKLQLKEGQRLALVNPPKGLKVDAPAGKDLTMDAVLVFVRNSSELRAHAKPALDAAQADRLAWIAYPKAGQLETDLNRDIVWKLLAREGVKPVRQIAVDDVWSALRLRPAA